MKKEKPTNSPKATLCLLKTIELGGDTDEAMGLTDCPDGCEVEPDGICPHNYLSAGRSLGVI